MESVIKEALAHDFAADSQQLVIRGSKLNFIDLGEKDKPVLLYVHGLAGTWSNWIFNLLPFSDRFRVIAVDLPGFGDSDMPKGTLTIEGYVETLKQLLEELGVKKVTLIGNSMGGQIGAVFGKRAPELLDHLVLVDPAGFSTGSHRLRRIAPLAPLLSLLLLGVSKIKRLVAFNRWLSAAVLKIVLFKPMELSGQLKLLLLDGVGKAGFVPAVMSIVEKPITKYPGTIDVPTTIVWGRNDLLIPKKDAFRYARMIPHSRLELMDGVGHIPMYETPERFNAVIESVVSGPVPAEPVVAG
jgi:pimeloyl-ACP methyl ester carboxylesterase